MKKNYKSKNKDRAIRSLAILLSAGMILQPLSAFAAEKHSGSFHVNQFGKYEVNADVIVEDNTISELSIKGEGFGGTHADINQMKLQSAIDGMSDKFVGLKADDIDGINNIDAVSGATISSNAIKGAVKNALSLEDEKVDINVPSKVPDKGEYNVVVSVRSDVVDHSLVQTPTANAKLKVDDKGNMRLSYKMVSGTKEEPMYILGFNGYYIDNDTSKGLSMDGVEYSTDKAGDHTVVTDVSYPLQGLYSTYYTNTKIFVPAMSNVDGNVSGIEFDHGKFDVKTFVTVYWDTLSTGTTEKKTTEITATVKEEAVSPDYVVVIPDKIEMGNLNADKDSVMDYEVRVDSKDKKGNIIVESDEKGNLYSGNNTLPFTNVFGKQIKDSSESETLSFPGQIIIYGKDVANAKPGNYKGTVTFSISYTPREDGGTDKPVTPVDPDKPSDPDIDIENLKDGVYLISGTMVKPDKTTLSMADKGINHTLKLTVKNNTPYITVDFKGIEVGDKLGYLGDIQYFDTGYTTDQYGYPKGTLKKVSIESYQKTDNGTLISDEYGTDYPDLVTFPLIKECIKDGLAPLKIYVPIMDSIAAGSGDQEVYLKLDWASIKKADSENPVIPEEPDSGADTGSAPGVKPMPGVKPLPGAKPLPGSRPGIGNSSLGKGPGGKNSLMKKGVKTGDTLETLGLWAGAALLSGIAVVVIYKKKKTDKR